MSNELKLILNIDIRPFKENLNSGLKMGKIFSDSMEKIIKGIDVDTSQIDKEFDKLQDKLKKFEADDISNTVDLVDQASPVIDKITGKVISSTKKQQSMFDKLKRQVMDFGFLAQGVEYGFQAAQRTVEALMGPFTEFQTGLHEVNTLLNLTDEQLEAVGGEILQLSEDTGKAADDLTKSVYQAVSAGVDMANALDLVEVAAKAGIAGLASTETAVDGVTTVLNAFHLEASQATNVADLMFQTVKLGKTTFSELAQNLSQVAPIAASSGISFDQVSAAVATLTKQGVPTAQGMTQIRAAIIGANEVLGDGWAKSMSLQEGFAKIAEQAGGSQTKLQELVGRVEAVGAILGTTGQNAQMAAKDLDAMKNSTGAMTAAYEIQADTIENRTARMIAKFDAMRIKVGQALVPVAEGLINIADKLLEVDYTPFISGTLAAAAALATLKLTTIITNLGGLVEALVYAQTAVGVFALNTSAAIASIPIVGWVAAAISALTTLGVYLYKSSKNEAELAEERKKTAQETIRIIEAEQDRVRQAIDTEGATDSLLTKQDELNEALIQQQKIIANADFLLYKKQMEEAEDEMKSMLGFFDEMGLKGNVAKRLMDTYGDNYLGMQSEINTHLERHSNILTDLAIKGDTLTDQEEKQKARSEKFLEVYNKIKQTVDDVVKSQDNMNDALEYRNQLNSGTQTQTTDVEVSTPGAPTVNVPVKPQIDDSFEDFFDNNLDVEIKVPTLPETDFLEWDTIPEMMEKAEKRLGLLYKNNMINEEQYKAEVLSARQVAYEETVKLYGKESNEALAARAKVLEFKQQCSQREITLHEQEIESYRVAIDEVLNIMNAFSYQQQETRNRELDQKKQRLEKELQSERKALKEKLKNGKISQEDYNRRMDELDKREEVRTKKLAAESQKRSNIEKATAIAQTMISTYEMATKAYKALAGIPVIGPVLAAAAAAAATLFGMQQVAAIQSTPAYKEGGLSKGGRKLAWLNEEGEEYIFHHYATKTIGEDLLTKAMNNPEQARDALSQMNAPRAPIPRPKFAFASGGSSLDVPNISIAREVSHAVNIQNEGIRELLREISDRINNLELTAEIREEELALLLRKGEYLLQKGESNG